MLHVTKVTCIYREFFLYQTERLHGYMVTIYLLVLIFCNQNVTVIYSTVTKGGVNGRL